MIYLHPWELDPDQPREANARLKSRLRHYTNLHTVESKLRRLLTEFSFGSVREVYGHAVGVNAQPLPKGRKNA
jgi:hypothetical protein